MTPVVLTEVDKKHANLQTTPLHDLFHSPDTSTSTFRTCFYVTKVEPGNVQDAVKVYSKQTKKASSAKGAKGGDLIYQVQLLVKDASTLSNTNQYKILNYSNEGLGANFFGKASNMWSDASALKKLEKQVATLKKFNVWVDAVVERRNGWYTIKDTRLRI